MWLSPGGAALAAVLGAAVAAGTGWRGVAVLAVFLVSSSLLTPGGGRRRPVQVIANGGVATLAALLARAHPGWTLAFAGAVAAAAADTWSTELGARSRREPRLITTGRPVARGTSGGVTLLGSLAGAAGALMIGASAWTVGLMGAGDGIWVAAAGVAGGVADSLVGATLQARYRCGACGMASEAQIHDCGGAGMLASGVGWITNDTVNFLATAVGAVIAAAPVALRGAVLA
jgi:uncharacterized protein (TIGR00297 family)